MNRAFQEGIDQTNREADRDGILWGYRFVHSGKLHFRPAHKALDGFVAPKNDPRWAQIGPMPSGHNCGCHIRGISDWEAARDGYAANPATPVVSDPETGASVDAVHALAVWPKQRFDEAATEAGQ